MNAPNVYPAAGEVIDGKYQIERMLGEGGMGAVARAMHLLRRAPVALKFMSPGIVSFPGAVERFLNEGVAASQIDSDHVVHIFDVGKLPGGAPYLVMEYMDGRDLSRVLEHEGRPGLEVARAVHFTLQTLRGLQVAHDAGIIHRDMKPSNCFVINKEGEPDFVKLLDFGISKVGTGQKSASLTQTNSALGTPLYMSPEQARSPRDVDVRSDLYSVGVILYELLTGRTPFNSESGEFTEILFKLFTQDPPPIRSLRPELAPELAAAVHRALAREPGSRYASAQEFGVALEAFADARSARVIQRLRSHVAGTRASGFPSASLAGAAPVAAAFSKLGAATGPMPPGPSPSGANQPPAPAASTPPAAPPLAQTPGRHSAYPEAQAARAGSPEEAVAATQFHPAGPAPAPAAAPPTTAAALAGKQTDLGAARDTSVGAVPAPAGKKGAPMAVAIAALVGVGVVGAAGYKLTRSSPTSHEAAASSLVEPEPPPPPAPPAMPSASAPAPVVSVAPSASASASVAAPAASPPKHAAAPAPSTSGGKVHLKDLRPIE